MGNDVSRLNGLEINEKAIQVTDFWAHYHATVNEKSLHFGVTTSGAVSVFKGDTAVLGPLWITHTPLEKCSNSLLKYRHPSILRFISSWKQHSNVILATEVVYPLLHMLPSQGPLQICVGLNSILHALVFLHDTAKMSHNNVCINSIFVTPDGTWKLSGMEYVRPFVEMTATYLKQTRTYRYEKAIDSDEELHNNVSKVDQFAFGTLVDEVFLGRDNDDVPFLTEFKQYCRAFLQNQDVALRPSLRTVMCHDFFNHDFVTVHTFLSNLPVKSESEKTELFSSLMATLYKFNQEIVASQLGGLLLSRLVLLDSTAREKILPQLLKPRNENSAADGKSGFFTFGVFKKYIIPKLLQVFCVRDAQIRTLLLIHFHNFVGAFSDEELTEHILPELLLGIKDTDDNLVSMTLRCLAELVLLLGATTVIGGKRSKIFSDGRPLQHLTPKQHVKSTTGRHDSGSVKYEMPVLIEEIPSKDRPNLKTVVDFPCSEDIFHYGSDSNNIEISPHLHERPSPDGGEDLAPEKNHIYIENFKSNGDDNWGEWHDNEKPFLPPNLPDGTILDSFVTLKDIGADVLQSEANTDDKSETAIKLNPSQKQEYMHKASINAKMKKMADISELDIKNQTNNTKGAKVTKDEFDFFADMVPVIEKPSIINVACDSSHSRVGDTESPTFASSTISLTNKFQFIPPDDVDLDDTIKSSAWDDDDWT